jgi:hypothetical protein
MVSHQQHKFGKTWDRRLGCIRLASQRFSKHHRPQTETKGSKMKHKHHRQKAPTWKTSTYTQATRGERLLHVEQRRTCLDDRLTHVVPLPPHRALQDPSDMGKSLYPNHSLDFSWRYLHGSTIIRSRTRITYMAKERLLHRQTTKNMPSWRLTRVVPPHRALQDPSDMVKSLCQTALVDFCWRFLHGSTIIRAQTSN